MDRSESNKSASHNAGGVVSTQPPLEIEVPKRSITIELLVGVFTLVGVIALGLQAIGLGGLTLISSDRYDIQAEFDNISGLKKGAAVEVAGVQVGEVHKVELRDPTAIVTLRLKNTIPVYEEDIASVRTQGIIGDKYVKILRGGSMEPIKAGGTIIETESVVDIEDLIGKLVHSMSSDDE